MVTRFLLALVLLAPAVAAEAPHSDAAFACEPVTTGNNFPYVEVHTDCLPSAAASAAAGGAQAECDPVDVGDEPPFVRVYEECLLPFNR